MIRIIFDNGELIDCEHISKMYIEELEMDKVTIVGCIPKEGNDVRESDRGTEESDTDTGPEAPIG